MATREIAAQIVASTRGPRAHFFGYYDKTPWDATGRYLLSVEADPFDRLPLPGEKAVVGLVDLESDMRFEPLAETLAWNWQQGCMLQWMPNAPDREIIYNDIIDGAVTSIILDVHTARKRILPRPVYSIAPDGAWAATTSFARLADTRGYVGYAGVADPYADELHPARDGLWKMDLSTGAATLLVSFDKVARNRRVPSMSNVKHRFEHLVINPDGSRVFFMHRWRRTEGKRPFHDRMYTVSPDGSDLCLITGDDFVSHFDWRDSGHILAWARVGGIGDRLVLYTDRTDLFEIIGDGVIDRDCHCSYSPDRRWILGDTYPDIEPFNRVWIYSVERNERIDLGRFPPPELYRTFTAIRCDLHPRWSRDGRQVCIDAAHEGPRQMYILDAGRLMGKPGDFKGDPGLTLCHT